MSPLTLHLPAKWTKERAAVPPQRMLQNMENALASVSAASQVFSPLDPAYGAVGDDTADDGPALQACLDDAQAAGGTVVLGPYGYLSNQTLVWPRGVSILGAGAVHENRTVGSWIRQGSPTLDVIQFEAGSPSFFPGSQTGAFFTLKGGRNSLTTDPAGTGPLIHFAGFGIVFDGPTDACFRVTGADGNGANWERNELRYCSMVGGQWAIRQDWFASGAGRCDKNLIDHCTFEYQTPPDTVNLNAAVVLHATLLAMSELRSCVWHGDANSRGGLIVLGAAYGFAILRPYMESMCRRTSTVALDEITVAQNQGGQASQDARVEGGYLGDTLGAAARSNVNCPNGYLLVDGVKAVTNRGVRTAGNFGVRIAGGNVEAVGRAGTDTADDDFWKVGSPPFGVTLTFNSPWVNEGSGTYPDAMVKRHPDGTVELRGAVKNGAAGSVIFKLPASGSSDQWGFWPTREQRFAVATNSGYGELAVQPDGDVILVSGGTGRVHLDGVRFQAAKR